MNGKNHGRPKGRPNTKGRILEITVGRLATGSADELTLRSISEEVGVDPASIIYHFGSKEQLLFTALAMAYDPHVYLLNALKGDRETLVDRLLSAIIEPWEKAEFRNPALHLIAAAAGDSDMISAVQSYYDEEIIQGLAEALGGPKAQQRAAALTTTIAGMVFARYIIRIPSIVALSREEYLAIMDPQLRAIFNK